MRPGVVEAGWLCVNSRLFHCFQMEILLIHQLKAALQALLLFHIFILFFF